jgi:HAMP domain-containing protein
MGKSIIFRASILYFVLLLANITVMILMVFENQVDLIAQNTQVNSRLIGLRFREAFGDTDIYAPDSALLDSFNVTSYRVYTGSGRLVSAAVGNADTDLDRTAGIHTALTRRDFENRLFHHVVDHRGRELELYIPVSTAEMNDHVVVATVALDGVDRQIGYLYRQATILGLLVLALHLLYAWYLAHTVLRPMRRIMAATEHVTHGDLGVRINLPERNELGQMATAFNEMSVAIVRMQNEARSSNPLTELPGNPVIAETLTARLATSVAVLYIDLDNFKAFNDHYGFTRGDEALIFARDCIVTEAQSTPDTFVGHQGRWLSTKKSPISRSFLMNQTPGFL